MVFISIDSSKISDEIFAKFERAPFNYKFSPKLRTELRNAFKGKVSLEKFRPHNANSQALILQEAKRKNLQIPTSKEWSAILLAAETMAVKQETKEEKLLNDSRDGMLFDKFEITNTALVYNAGKNTPVSVIDNLGLVHEKAKALGWFPDKSGYIPIPQGKEMLELGLPTNAYVFVAPPPYGGLRSVVRGDWTLHPGGRHFDTGAGWGPLELDSHLASRVVHRER